MSFRNWPAALGCFIVVALFTGCGTTGTKHEKRKRGSDAESVSQQQVIPAAAGAAGVSALLPPDAQQTYRRAVAAMQSNDYAGAEQMLNKVLSISPEFTEARTNLAITEFRLGRISQAEDDLNRAVKEDPKNAIAYNYLGILYRVKGKFPEAATAYQQALNANPNYALAQLNLGILYDLYLRDLNKALESYQRYQTLVPAEDKDVTKWITDLKRRIDSGK